MVKKRVILWWMLLSGILVHMLHLTNMNVAIVSMVSSIKSDDYDAKVGICGRPQVWEKGMPNLKNSRYPDISSRNNSLDKGRLNWSIREQNAVLGAFLWFAFVAQFFGGFLSHKYGSKIVFGGSNFVASAVSSLIPIFSFIDVKLVVGARLVQGFTASLGMPAGVSTIMGNWAPPDEIGKFSCVTLGVCQVTITSYVFTFQYLLVIVKIIHSKRHFIAALAYSLLPATEIINLDANKTKKLEFRDMPLSRSNLQ